jgi:hypothetical protein
MRPLLQDRVHREHVCLHDVFQRGHDRARRSVVRSTSRKRPENTAPMNISFAGV